MNEEINIIELLQRVKEGKAPKEIEIEGRKYRCSIIDEIYDYIRVGSDDRYFDLVDDYNIFELKDTKIKILDKPIIEELPNRYGYKTWKELTDKVGIENERAFIDFFNGKQCLTREQLEKTFKILEIPIELLELYTEEIVKYKIKNI